MTSYAPVAITIHLDPLVVLVLDALAAHLSKSRDETIADALRCYFAVLPRPGEGKP